MSQRLQAKDIKLQLDILIGSASSLYPEMAKRLAELKRWIKDKKEGLLQSKKILMDFLVELILDCRFLLTLKQLPPEEKTTLFNQLTPAQAYWYDTLLPKWFEETDPQLETWKRKMMAGEFSYNDLELLNNIVDQVNAAGGNSLTRYILDLSMATDLVVNGAKKLSLCVQLTTVDIQKYPEKKDNWKLTLRYWTIERGLFISFVPQNLNVLDLANLILQRSDILPAKIYSVHTT